MVIYPALATDIPLSGLDTMGPLKPVHVSRKCPRPSKFVVLISNTLVRYPYYPLVLA